MSTINEKQNNSIEWRPSSVQGLRESFFEDITPTMAECELEFSYNNYYCKHSYSHLCWTLINALLCVHLILNHTSKYKYDKWRQMEFE